MTRNEVLKKMREANIGVTVHYHPLHAMPLYANLKTSALPVTESVAENLITLPISSSMTESDAHYVCDHLQSVLGR